MQGFTHCQECGQALRDAVVFCRPCGQAFCSKECLEKHQARHPKVPEAKPGGLTDP